MCINACRKAYVWRINSHLNGQEKTGSWDWYANKSQKYTGGSEVFATSGKTRGPGSSSFRFIFEIKFKPFATSNSSCQLYCRGLSFSALWCLARPLCVWINTRTYRIFCIYRREQKECNSFGVWNVVLLVLMWVRNRLSSANVKPSS